LIRTITSIRSSTARAGYELSIDDLDTHYVLVAVRTLVDPTDPRDLEAVTALRDGPALSAESATPFSHPAWDKQTLTATRNTLLKLARASVSSTLAFGSRQQTDPIAHLLSTASGCGGLPAEQAYYLRVRTRTSGRPLHPFSRRSPGPGVLVDQRPQRGGLLREERPGQVFGEERHRRGKP
jgi:hypothetical protein